jgi:hypothetical protein
VNGENPDYTDTVFLLGQTDDNTKGSITTTLSRVEGSLSGLLVRFTTAGGFEDLNMDLDLYWIQRSAMRRGKVNGSMVRL